MPLNVPKLDDRHFQDIVDEAKKRIPHYTKEWTDHNVSDPGVTLIELFAWMTDILLYRLNQVPDLHYIKFMELFGIRLQGPVPAHAEVTFWLSAPQSIPVLIPAGTEVSSTQTETEQPVIFTTTQSFRVDLPQLSAVLSRVAPTGGGDPTFREQNLRRIGAGFEGFDVFSQVPQVGEALYLGFENDLSRHILGLEMDFDPAGGAGIDPTLPPYIWEASIDSPEGHWQTCEVELDTTRGMNTAGKVRLFLPAMGRYEVDGKQLFWVRVRLKEISPAETKEGMRPYRQTPRLRQILPSTWGGTAPASHARKINREPLGQSDGSPGQRFFLKNTPILARQADEVLSVQVDGAPSQVWQETPDFSGSSASDCHYTLDSLTGEIRFGPAVRQPDGTIRLYGAIPPRAANLLFECYTFGGGQQGNVQENILNTLKTAIPYIARVTNRQPAWGGLDAESLEAAMMRAPAALRTKDRAVTERDFEFLAQQALPAAIGRVKCLQPNPADAAKVAPGQVYLLVIPRIPHPEAYLDPARLELKAEDTALLRTYLDERRLLTTRLDIRPPAYQWAAVKVKLRAVPGAKQAEVESEIYKRLYRFLNPLTGGPDGDGWPFGRDLFISDVYQCLQGAPNVQFIRGVEMYTAKAGAEPQGSPLETLEVVAHGVIASGKHSLEFV
jgi:predicted phage baseplate assembly protein